ncbi:hypothetical protein [Modestobacter sp. SSW1-42]|uniref:hypothetical protein n=1 Tax=Modestobacter sp. SSW1-42 TaxID=596372 RepID=UPI0039886609
MASVWILSPHNLYCPGCETRLIERAGRFAVPGRPRPVHVGEVGTLRCRAGHPLPSREELYAHRDEQGRPRTAAVWEVAPPDAAPAGAARC